MVHDGIFWNGSRFLTTNFEGEDQKKGLRCKILGFVLAFSRAFRPGTRLYPQLGGGGSTGPEMHFSGTGPVTFIWGTIFAWRGAFLALGAQLKFSRLVVAIWTPIVSGVYKALQ